MAPEIRSTGTDLDGRATVESELWARPQRFTFFQVVRLLERLAHGGQPVGQFPHGEREVVRFRGHPSLAFPASEIQSLDLDDDGMPVMTLNVFSLVGALGTLPTHYSVMVEDESGRDGASPLSAFLDIFTHRLASLFYRAWEKYRFPIAFERAARHFAHQGADASPLDAGDADAFSRFLFSLIGMGTIGLRGRLEAGDHMLLFYAGLLARRPRSAASIEGILTDYFAVPIAVVPFIGEWFDMSEMAGTQLGSSEPAGSLGRNHQLGVDAVLWERVWDPQAKFRVRVGPLTREQFDRFMPGGESYRQLVELTRLCVGGDMHFDVQLVLHGHEVPRFELGGASGVRLGWSSWLDREITLGPAAHAVFDLQEERAVRVGTAA